MFKKILLIILLIFAQENLLPQTIYETLNSEIKSVYGSSFEVSSYLKIDSSFINSNYNLSGLITDPYGTLDNSIVFTAIDNSNGTNNCNSLVGVYKNGSISWASPQVINSEDIVATRIFATVDLNKDGNVDILTNWIKNETFAPMYCWIFSWNGTSGYFINDIDQYCESVVYTISSADFKLADIEGDGIWEIEGYEMEEGEPEIINGEENPTYLFSPIIFKWDGEKYIMLDEQQTPPPNFVYPRNNLNLTVKATASTLDSTFYYQFTVKNLINSPQAINEFVLGLAIDSLNSAGSPPGWTFKMENSYPFWLSDNMNNHFIKPGESRNYSLACNKFPYIIKYYSLGYNLPNFSLPPDQELLVNSKIGYTIGPEVFLDTISTSAFLDSLLSINTRSFNLSWITNQSTVDKYDSLFNTAKTELQQNNNNAAKTTLQTVLQEVDIDSTNNLTSEAYALLRYNTEYLINQIPVGSPGLPIKLINSQGSLLPGGSLKYYDAGWKDAIENGDGTFTVQTERTTVSLKMTYEYGTQQIDNVPVGSDTAIFQTVNAAVELRNSLGNLIDEGTVQYYAGGWRVFGTTINGTATKELLPKNYSFRMTYAFASNDRQQDISLDPTVVFQTVNAAVELRNSLGNLIDEGTVKYYAGGWRVFGTTANGTATKELLPKNYSFRMKYEYGSIDKQQDISVDPTVVFQTVNTAVELRNSSGNLIDEGMVQYYAGGWRDFGTTVNGVANKELLPKNYSFRMSYEYISNDKQQDISADPTVVFQTVNAAVELRNSSGVLIDEGTVKYYAGGWRVFGTTINGTATKELLPKNYSFRMSYEYISNDKQQDLNTNSTLTFSTVLCTVKVSDTNNQPLENAETKYYSGSWRDIGLTNTDGEITKELLPKTLSFRAIYGSASEDKQQDISVNSLVEFILNTQ